LGVHRITFVLQKQRNSVFISINQKLFLSRRNDQKVDGTMASINKQLPLFLFCIMLSISSVIYIYDYANNQRNLQQETLVHAQYSAQYIESEIMNRIDLIQIFAHEWVTTQNASELSDSRIFYDEVPYYFDYFSGYLAINWIDSNGTIRWVYPVESNTAAINRSIIYLLTGDLNSAFAIAKNDHQVGMTNVTTLFQGGKGMVTYQPLNHFNKTSQQLEIVGFFNMVVRINSFIDQMINNTPLLSDFSFSLIEYNQEIYHFQDQFDLHSDYVVEQNITFYNRTWMLYFRPTQFNINDSLFSDLTYLLPLALLASCIALGFSHSLIKKNLQLDETIREKNKIEGKLIQAQKMEALGTLAGGVAHDFNNILMGMQGNFYLLSESVFENPKLTSIYSPYDLTEIKEEFQNVSSLFSRAKDLINQILQFSRNIEYDFTPFELTDHLRSTLKIFNNSIDKRIKLTINITSNSLYILGDPTRLQLAFTNVLVNARDALPDGGEIIFSLQIRPLTKLTNDFYQKPPYNGQEVVIIIHDNGIGIPEENLSKIFDPFFTTKPREKGTGFGLSIVYNTIKIMKGLIEISSKKDVGTDVTIILPLIIPEHNKDHNQKNHIAKISAKNESQNSYILIIEDEDAIRSSLQKYLLKQSFQIQMTGSGKEGLEIYQRNPQKFFLVILDVNLPDLNGIEIYNTLKLVNPSQSFLFITGYSEAEIPDKYLPNIQFLQKPFSFSVLNQKINRFLDLWKKEKKTI
jgi:signal transduction histidine kinase